MARQKKVRRKPLTDKAKRSPRWLWLQYHLDGDRIESSRKFITWTAAVAIVESRLNIEAEVEAAYLID